MTRTSRNNKRLVGCLLVLACGLLLLRASDVESKGGFAKIVGGAAGSAAGKAVATSMAPSAAGTPSAVVTPSGAPVAAVQKQTSSVRYTPVQPMQFDFSTKKDPFKPYITVKTEAAVAGPAKRPTKAQLPIHSFGLEQFRLIGVVADPAGNKAMVVDPSGKGYILKVGMTIGTDEARVTRIDGSGVDTLRNYRDENGKLRKETVRIPLLRKP